MSAPTIMVQGTASSVGKSVVVTALCRWFARAGIRVAPFKSQNMALNAAVTPDGREIGRAQAIQADACGLAPTVEMNPILIKPEGDKRSQIVVRGRPLASMSAVEYHAHKRQLHGVISDCLETLRANHDLVIIEGAGSPAEINLKDRDIVNMYVAKMADAPVLLVGDIDRGGVFAAFVGTLALLEPDERDRVAGFIINKFRGDRALLEPGLDDLTARTGKPVVGVLPHLPRLRVADEDSLALDDRRSDRRAVAGELEVAVVRLPRISNHDDVEPLEHEPGVVVVFTDDPAVVRAADLAILPGSKSTASDLAWLRAHGLARAIEQRAAAGAPVLGICGGCQMLGESIADPHGVESGPAIVAGLGLLPIRTTFGRTKTTAVVRAVARAPSFLMRGTTAPVRGYEIHMGTVEPTTGAAPPLEIVEENGAPTLRADGAISLDGTVVGTMVHGILDDDAVRASVLGELRRRRGWSRPIAGTSTRASRAAEYDRLADAIEANVDARALWHLAKLDRRRAI